MFWLVLLYFELLARIKAKTFDLSIVAFKL